MKFKLPNYPILFMHGNDRSWATVEDSGQILGGEVEANFQGLLLTNILPLSIKRFLLTTIFDFFKVFWTTQIICVLKNFQNWKPCFLFEFNGLHGSRVFQRVFTVLIFVFKGQDIIQIYDVTLTINSKEKKPLLIWR